MRLLPTSQNLQIPIYLFLFIQWSTPSEPLLRTHRIDHCYARAWRWHQKQKPGERRNTALVQSLLIYFGSIVKLAMLRTLEYVIGTNNVQPW